MDHCFFRQVFQKRIILLGNKTDTVFILRRMDKLNKSYHYFKNILRKTIDIVYLRSNDCAICYIAVQIKQKILPKLHGSEKAIGNVLTNLFNICLVDRNNNENPKNFTITEENCRYCTSALKLQNMSKVLSDQRYVSFIN